MEPKPIELQEHHVISDETSETTAQPKRLRRIRAAIVAIRTICVAFLRGVGATYRGFARVFHFGAFWADAAMVVYLIKKGLEAAPPQFNPVVEANIPNDWYRPYVIPLAAMLLLYAVWRIVKPLLKHRYNNRSESASFLSMLPTMAIFAIFIVVYCSPTVTNVLNTHWQFSSTTKTALASLSRQLGRADASIEVPATVVADNASDDAPVTISVEGDDGPSFVAAAYKATLPAAKDRQPLEKHFAFEEKNYGPWVRQQSVNHHVDEGIIYAVMTEESHGNPRAESPVGARGLMQLMPEHTRGWNPEDPKRNIKKGTEIFCNLIALYGYPQAIAAYNAGEGGLQAAELKAKRLGGKTFWATWAQLPLETRMYVLQVMRTYAAYHWYKVRGHVPVFQEVEAEASTILVSSPMFPDNVPMPPVDIPTVPTPPAIQEAKAVVPSESANGATEQIHRQHRVRERENAGVITRTYRVSLMRLQKANPEVKDWNHLETDQILNIPDSPNAQHAS